MDIITSGNLPLGPEKIETLYEELLEREYRNLPLKDIFVDLSPQPKSLNRIEMSTRARNVLWRQNVNTLRELEKFTISEINDFRNSGPGTMFELVSLYLLNLEVKLEESSEQEYFDIENPRGNFSTIEVDHFQYVPVQIMKFLAQISGDLTVRDLHIINARSKLGETLTHGAVAEDWGITRQRIHQLENHLSQRFRGDPLLQEIRDVVLPVNSFRGSSELIYAFPWLNLGVAIHPIGVSIFQLLIFSQLLMVDKSWIISHEESSYQKLKTRVIEVGVGGYQELINSVEISAEVLDDFQDDIDWSLSPGIIDVHREKLTSGQGFMLNSQDEGDLLLDKLLANIRKGPIS